MGDTETFASELDRLIWPYVEYLDDHQHLLSDDAFKALGKGDDEEWHRYFLKDDLTQIVVNWWSDDAGPLNGFEVTWKGESVYQRVFGGPTKMLRPGEWVTSLVSLVHDKQAKDEFEAIEAALDRALARIPAFAPI